MQAIPRLRTLRRFVSFLLSAIVILSSWAGMAAYPESASAAASPVVAVFQEGLDGYTDMQFTAVGTNGTPSSGDQNFGQVQILNFANKYNGANDYNLLIQFGLSTIPADAVVTNANLELLNLNFPAPVNSAPATVDIYKVTQSWDENQITWNNSVLNAVYYDPTPYDTQEMNGYTTGTAVWSSFDLTGLAQQWVNGSMPNYGIMLQVDPMAGSWKRSIASDNHSTQSYHPKLTVTYTIPPTGVDVTPSDMSLIAGGSTGQLTASVQPAEATDQNVTWTSSDSAVATVDAGGIVTPVGPGTATITATTEDGGFSDASVVTVFEPNALSNLSISQGGLTPAFDSEKTSYTASVANGVNSLTVTPTLADPNAAVMVNGTPAANGVPSQPIELSVGDNEIAIVVTAQDGTKKTYTVTVTRAAGGNADLSNLELSDGALNPAFDAGQTSYTTSVANSVYSLSVTSTVYDSNATIRVNGSPVSSGMPSQPIPLNVGANPIQVTVTAADGQATKTYTVTVTRASVVTPPSSPGTGTNAGTGTEPPADESGNDGDNSGNTSQPPTTACPTYAWNDTQTHWAKAYIESAAQMCIVQGVSSERFLPNEGATRLQFALMVARGMKLQAKATGDAENLEVYKDRDDIPAWALGELSAAIQAGIIKGYDDGMLRPNQIISRAEMATMLIRGTGQSASTGTTSFADDADIPNWARGYVAQAEQLGITEGSSNNRYEPNRPATRAEAAIFVVRMFKDKK